MDIHVLKTYLQPIKSLACLSPSLSSCTYRYLGVLLNVELRLDGDACTQIIIFFLKYRSTAPSIAVLIHLFGNL